MKKYKHKINGSIAEFVFTKSLTKDGFYSVKHKEGFTHIPIEFIENSNDWEEIKEEPNYLITAFLEKGTGAHRPVNKDGLYGYTEPFKHLDIMLEEEHEIYSVKNSKGEEFTIGDSVMYEKEKFTISNFNVNEMLQIHHQGKSSKSNSIMSYNSCNYSIFVFDMFHASTYTIKCQDKRLSLPEANKSTKQSKMKE
jgi:hypothetical protein